MPGLDGIAVAEKLVTELPTCGSLILTSYGRPGHLKRALAMRLSAGSCPRPSQPRSWPTWYAPSTAAAATSTPNSPPTPSAPAATRQPAHPREADVLELAAGGALDEIAKRAALTPGTVRNYLSSAAAKLGAANRHEAVQLARSRGWI